VPVPAAAGRGRGRRGRRRLRGHRRGRGRRAWPGWGGRYHPARFFPQVAASDRAARRLLAEVAEAGLRFRYLAAKGPPPPADVVAALRAELALVADAGLAELLLTAEQAGAFCAERGIPLAARGSATASLVAWALGLVEVCPLDHWLRASTRAGRTAPTSTWRSPRRTNTLSGRSSSRPATAAGGRPTRGRGTCPTSGRCAPACAWPSAPATPSARWGPPSA
jgi:hypothetical protein